MVPRVARPAIVLACVLTLAGCGDADPTAFASATDRACVDLGRASQTLRADLVRRDGPDAERATSAAIDAYAASVGTLADRLAAVDPPRADRAFRTGAVDGLRAHATTMRRAATAARRGRLGDALATELRSGTASALPEVPEAVLADAPACRTPAR